MITSMPAQDGKREHLALELRNWLTGPASERWLTCGVDRTRGGFYDQLSPENAANVCDFKRLRVTCRQIFVFATLAGFEVPGASEAMEHGLAFLFDHLRHPDGGFMRSVTLAGEPLDSRRDLYDLAFTIFALAAAAARTGDPDFEDEASKLLTFIHEHMSHPTGGFVEALPPILPRRQNPHMHLLEACLAWFPLARSGHFLETARTLLAMLERHFWSSHDRCLYEYFTDDWRLIDDVDCQIFEPGHHCEWIWLLREASAAGLAIPPISAEMAETVRRYGFATETGLPFATVAADGSCRDSQCRIWVITEWLRVCATHDMQTAGPPEAPAQHLKRFLDHRVSGLWHERCDARTGNFIRENVPASSLYHIVTGLLPLLDGSRR